MMPPPKIMTGELRALARHILSAATRCWETKNQTYLVV